MSHICSSTATTLAVTGVAVSLPNLHAGSPHSGLQVDLTPSSQGRVTVSMSSRKAQFVCSSPSSASNLSKSMGSSRPSMAARCLTSRGRRISDVTRSTMGLLCSHPCMTDSPAKYFLDPLQHSARLLFSPRTLPHTVRDRPFCCARQNPTTRPQPATAVQPGLKF